MSGFRTKGTAMKDRKDRYVISFEELGTDEYKVVGKKCANLGEMVRIGMPVPSGFALTIECHRRFFYETGIAGEIKEYIANTFPNGLEDIKAYNEASAGIYSIIESKAIPDKIRRQVLSGYENLCKRYERDQVPVAVRSAGAISHPGQYETFLNVKGETDLLNNIIKVWASAFNPRSLAAISQAGLSVTESPYIGIAVQCIIETRAAGVCFTVDPLTGDPSKIVLESSWGMGESIVGGTVSPDKYVMDKQSLEVLEKIPGVKKSQIVCLEGGNTEELEVPLEMQLMLCINEEEAKRIAEFAKTLESHFGSHQDIEWGLDLNGNFPRNVYLLQTRPAKVAIKKPESVSSHIAKLIARQLSSH
jgi:pyruvate,water dikinase